MLAIIVGTAVGGVLTVVLVHYLRIGLRRWLRRPS